LPAQQISLQFWAEQFGQTGAGNRADSPARRAGGSMTRRKRMLADLEQDIREHLERETQDNIDRGMTPDEARHAALLKFGNVTRVKDQTYSTL
jgi:hypothetical protein